MGGITAKKENARCRRLATLLGDCSGQAHALFAADIQGMMETATAPHHQDHAGGKNAHTLPLSIWLGMDFFAWLRLLRRNRFAVGLSFVPIAFLITMTSVFNTLLRIVQTALYGRRVSRTAITEQPVFIIGHWRSGTTLLHELLCVDERHTYPTTFACFAPNHFLISEEFASRRLCFLLPPRRPMDNVTLGWERPQEDEWALCMLGQPSSNETIAFPNRPPSFLRHFDLEGLSPESLQGWKRSYIRFLKQLTFKNPKRLILKSPQHTCRIKVLLELFPEASFVHIVRDPYVVFPSTVHLWNSLYSTQGLQHPTYNGLQDYVFDTFVHMDDKLEEARHLLDPSRFCEIRYEELVRDPVKQMRALYENLDLGDFEKVLPALEQYLEGVKEYQTNRYELSPKLRDQITRRWGPFIRRYGYSERSMIP
jgi:hypothetical protein